MQVDHLDEFGEPVYLAKHLPRSVEYKLGDTIAKYVLDDSLGVMVLDSDFYQAERNFFQFVTDRSSGKLQVSRDYMMFVIKHVCFAGRDVAQIIQIYQHFERPGLANWTNVLTLLQDKQPDKAKQLLLHMLQQQSY